MKFNMAANRTKGESLRSANKDVGRRARKETTDLPRRMLVGHDSNSTFNTYEDLDLAESDRMMSKQRPASTKISIKTTYRGMTTRKTAQLEEWSQMMIEKLGRRHALIICPPRLNGLREIFADNDRIAVADQGKWIDYMAIENRAEMTQCCSESPKANPKFNVESNMIQDDVVVVRKR
ncbi:hypothetical protein B0H13DRAFT_2446349 [Mycena leptocephala]|nr:hypothetical protein B0H13DRAFT_2446349 [Mycena leptocephala]